MRPFLGWALLISMSAVIGVVVGLALGVLLEGKAAMKRYLTEVLSDKRELFRLFLENWRRRRAERRDHRCLDSEWLVVHVKVWEGAKRR